MTENIGTYTLTDQDIEEAYSPVLESKYLTCNDFRSTKRFLKDLKEFTQLADSLSVENILTQVSKNSVVFSFQYEVPPTADVVRRRIEKILQRKAFDNLVKGVTN